jgi:hypothetical protein
MINKLKYYIENLENKENFQEKKIVSKCQTHTCNPGCSQNNGTEPRICMKEETESSKYTTYKKKKKNCIRKSY